jgi:hypothetical protein
VLCYVKFPGVGESLSFFINKKRITPH